MSRTSMKDWSYLVRFSQGKDSVYVAPLPSYRSLEKCTMEASLYIAAVLVVHGGPEARRTAREIRIWEGLGIS